MIKELGQGVQIWAEANRNDLTRDGRTKTAKFAAGEISWRTRPPRPGLFLPRDRESAVQRL